MFWEFEIEINQAKKLEKHLNSNSIQSKEDFWEAHFADCDQWSLQTKQHKTYEGNNKIIIKIDLNYSYSRIEDFRRK